MALQHLRQHLDAADRDLDEAGRCCATVGYRPGSTPRQLRVTSALYRRDEARVLALSEEAVAAARARRRGQGDHVRAQLGLAMLGFGRLDRAEPELLAARRPPATGGAIHAAVCGLMLAVVAAERGDYDLATDRLRDLDGGEVLPARPRGLARRGGGPPRGEPAPEVALDGTLALLAEAAALTPGDAAAAHALAARLAASPPPPNHPDAVAAGRMVAALVERVAAAALVAGDDRLTLPDGTVVDLARRPTLRRVAARLVEQRLAAPGVALPLDAVLAAGWPGERILPEAGANRVYVAMATLRKLGLAAALLTRDDGYLLDPALAVVRA
ncbi:MAG: hypothetical protein R3F59_30160 [Myxococcota bacterium]